VTYHGTATMRRRLVLLLINLESLNALVSNLTVSFQTIRFFTLQILISIYPACLKLYTRSGGQTNSLCHGISGTQLVVHISLIPNFANSNKPK
jgi:hypothetical protein